MFSSKLFLALTALLLCTVSNAFNAITPTRAFRSTSTFLQMMEKTYIMIKPDGVQRGVVGNIISRFESKGYKVTLNPYHYFHHSSYKDCDHNHIQTADSRHVALCSEADHTV